MSFRLSHGTQNINPLENTLKIINIHAQVKTSNTSENLVNKIHQIIYSLYREKEITKKVYNNIINSIKL